MYMHILEFSRFTENTHKRNKYTFMIVHDSEIFRYMVQRFSVSFQCDKKYTFLAQITGRMQSNIIVQDTNFNGWMSKLEKDLEVQCMGEL